MTTRPKWCVPVTDSLSPPEYACAVCAAVGPAALVVYPEKDRPTFALCPGCARDPAHLRSAIRALRASTIVVRGGARPPHEA